jgi:hypothetical protein
VIDTHREFNPEVGTRLSGRKYICEPCASEMGQAVGLVTSVEYLGVGWKLAQAEERIALLEGDLALALNEQHKVMDADEFAAQMFEKLEEWSNATSNTASAPKKAPTKPAAKAPVAP